MAYPLELFQIVDVSRTRPGWRASGILADYGARVITVVEPSYAPPFLTLAGKPVAGNFANLRNKRSIFLNLRSASGLGIFLRLAQHSDAILESNRPGVAQRLGIDYESVREVNPAIVYCSLSGYGQFGPYRDIPGHDLSYQGVGGMLPLDEFDRPYMIPYPLADLNAIWNTAIAILIGLLSRAGTGVGQFIDVAYSDSAVSLPDHSLAETLRGRYPCYNLYETKDGEFITLSIVEPLFWERLCHIIDRPDWIPHQYPQEPMKEEMFAFLRQTFRSRTREDWIAILRRGDTQFGPVNRTVEAIANDPHNRARGSVVEVASPVTGRKTLEPGFALKFSQTPAAVWYEPTLMGSETQEILEELGYSGSEILRFRDEGAVR